MMYQNKVVLAVKSNGKILREMKDVIQLPYGSEFSILVKNLDSRRIKFRLHIDGQDVLDKTEIIVNANSETEIKRFIHNGNMNEGNAFRFIERTQVIEDGPRGIKVDDGIIRVEFWHEKEMSTGLEFYKQLQRDDKGYYGSPRYYDTLLRGMSTSWDSKACYNTCSKDLIQSANASSTEIGITVPGSKVDQKFQEIYGFNSEAQSHVIILRMTGFVNNEKVESPVTVKTKQKCVTCGKVNKISNNFCSACGTSLVIL